jgi:DNA-binding NtrC family response regulator
MGASYWISRNATTHEIPVPVTRSAAPDSPFRIVVVSNDPELRAEIAAILRGCSLNPVLADGLAELRSVYSDAAPIACLCGFDLADGTFHDVVDYLEQHPFQVPVVMISARSAGETPKCFLRSLQAGALATICYPYRLNDVQVVLWSVIQYQHELRRSS